MRSGHRHRWRHLKALRGNVVGPAKHKGDRKTEEQKDDYQAQPPVWQFPGRKCSGRHLYNACRRDDVSGRNPINVTPFCLLEEASHGRYPYVQSPKTSTRLGAVSLDAVAAEVTARLAFIET